MRGGFISTSFGEALFELFLNRRVPVVYAKAEAAKGYLHLVRGIRVVALINCALSVFATLSVLGAVLFVLGVVFYFTGLQKEFFAPTLIIGALLALIPLVPIVLMMSERFWLRTTKAEDLVRDVMHDNRRMHASQPAH